MSGLTDLLLASTDPVVALMLVGLAGYIRTVKDQLHADLKEMRDRVERVEDTFIAADGGTPETEDT